MIMLAVAVWLALVGMLRDAFVVLDSSSKRRREFCCTLTSSG